jgi:hypothetical protein
LLIWAQYQSFDAASAAVYVVEEDQVYVLMEYLRAAKVRCRKTFLWAYQGTSHYGGIQSRMRSRGLDIYDDGKTPKAAQPARDIRGLGISNLLNVMMSVLSVLWI